MAWTPKGYYTASADGERYVGWHVNRGVDRRADYYPVGQFRERFHRPEVVGKALELGDPEKALEAADLEASASGGRPASGGTPD